MDPAPPRLLSGFAAAGAERAPPRRLLLVPVQPPSASTFRAHVDALVPWLLQDYPVQMPSNLEQDVSCGDLWGLHFGLRALQHMGGGGGGVPGPPGSALGRPAELRHTLSHTGPPGLRAAAPGERVAGAGDAGAAAGGGCATDPPTSPPAPACAATQAG
ncbi:uncharacterized protein LOC135577944 isoform X2 [Columba livia]|uniref:uncharacterized protein LOC135577944 isoform X2 n=1 Tax=Columba livia TaxID=8932 RepID=UPI0031BA0EBB